MMMVVTMMMVMVMMMVVMTMGMSDWLELPETGNSKLSELIKNGDDNDHKIICDQHPPLVSMII